MSIQYVNTGTGPNSQDGDSIRAAFTKVNRNFTTLTEMNVTSATMPTNPVNGMIWFDLTTRIQYYYVVDADSSQWVAIGPTSSIKSCTVNISAEQLASMQPLQLFYDTFQFTPSSTIGGQSPNLGASYNSTLTNYYHDATSWWGGITYQGGASEVWNVLDSVSADSWSFEMSFNLLNMSRGIGGGVYEQMPNPAIDTLRIGVTLDSQHIDNYWPNAIHFEMSTQLTPDALYQLGDYPVFGDLILHVNSAMIHNVVPPDMAGAITIMWDHNYILKIKRSPIGVAVTLDGVTIIETSQCPIEAPTYFAVEATDSEVNGLLVINSFEIYNNATLPELVPPQGTNTIITPLSISCTTLPGTTSFIDDGLIAVGVVYSDGSDPTSEGFSFVTDNN